MKPLLSFLLVCLPLSLTEATLKEFTSSNNLFTSSIYKEISKKEPENFLVSPLSALTVLALTQSGAKDETGEELRLALHLPNYQHEIEANFKELKGLKKSEPYSLATANKIYLREQFQVRNEFKKVATEVFDSQLETVSFIKREEAAGIINKWVEEQTEGKIKNLVKASDLNDRTRAVLVNALYFKANWSVPFKSFQTFKQDFYKNGEEVIQVDTMHTTDPKKYFESKDLNAKFLELPFEGEDATLTVVLPNDKNGLPALENNLGKIFDSPKYEQEYVRIALPKFKVESQIDFKTVLKNMGVSRIFKDEDADLSGIAGEKGDLVVDKILQKTFVDVSEEGVEAAAATYVSVAVPLSGSVYLNEPKEFIADHPFIFYIKVQDVVIFAGRVVNPKL